jgi:hypothetical protein
MKSRRSIILVVIALVIVGNWISRRVETNAPAPSPAPEIKVTAPTEPPAPAVIPSLGPPPLPPADPEPAAPKPRSEESRAASRRDLENPLVPFEPSDTAAPNKAANSDPEVAADFDRISLMLRDYRTLAGENPVGTNAEIMKAIMGGNPKGAQLAPSEGQTLNEAGELLDRWGTPYFFHQLSKDLMEIHSAGPDRRMGTRDDIVGD